MSLPFFFLLFFSNNHSGAIFLSRMTHTLLKKIKALDVLDFYCTIIFPEQDNANHFLLISSFSFNTVKFQNRQNNFFFTRDVWAIPLKAIFTICYTGFSEDRMCFCFISFFSFIKSDKNMNKKSGENELFNKRKQGKRIS